ncbi:MAG: Hydroxyethylthiazole kinase [Methanomassiliicoccales archaeon PtaU1.Bin124]|nr:MAG: Hydroxyethylthiazole kinase [Methanomassiliicoccales archaeon PtaU1.Bin124]
MHHITNYVTVNDCANITLCIGGAPVMADAIEEVEEMVSMAGALVLNIGTLNSLQVESMLKAGKEANRRSIPVVLDPVGAGATKMRTEVANRLLEKLKIAVIKGNEGEIGVLAGGGGKVRGVDSMGLDGDHAGIVREYAKSTGSIVVMSGATDVISDGRTTYLVDNGHAVMGSVSGTGCMASSVVGAFAGSNENLLTASTAALVSLGIAGERAAKTSKGPGSFKMALFDETAALLPDDVGRLAKVRRG